MFFDACKTIPWRKLEIDRMRQAALLEATDNGYQFIVYRLI